MKSEIRIELAPDAEQVSYFVKAANVHKLAYNWAHDYALMLESKGVAHDSIQYTGFSMMKEFGKIKHEKFPIVSEVSFEIANVAINKHLSYQFYLYRSGNGPMPEKLCDDGRMFFTLKGRDVKLKARELRVPKLGFVKMKQKLVPKDGKEIKKIIWVNITRENWKWYAIFEVELKG